MTVRIKRIYEPSGPADGLRILVDRLWPRGLSKADAAVDEWLKDVAPSTGLRQWFGHDPALWPEFQARYRTELDADPPGLERLVELAERQPVTLLFAARDQQHNQAAALRDYLLERFGSSRRRRRAENRP
jgi:uncharacterized protein YeaO (DUF488 family)